MNSMYEVTVTTGDISQANTYNKVFITLVDTDGKKSDHTWLRSKNGVASFSIGAVSTFPVSSPASLGNLLLIELDKQPNPPFPEDSWFLSQVTVKSPEGDTYNFPVYRWISDGQVHQFREARDRVQNLWRNDAFFGYQFLNGVNPMIIQSCTVLPENFPVTDDMKGNIFLCDYKLLDGVITNVINDKKQYLAAPLILLHRTANDTLMPIAIQLLIPHTHFTLQINFLARQLLISDDGVFTKFAASGGEGMITIMRRAQSSLTYSSLCIPDDITERGLDSVPNFYYRDDGLRLWDIIHRFVQGLLGHYYKNDAEVQKDSELQSWIQEIFEHGFLSKDSAGFPRNFNTVAELVKFVTMVIFTGSCQHSAVNSGQYDYGGWMPNTPTSLQQPPPTTKGTTSKATMLQTFPDISTTVHGMSTLWLLSRQYSDFIPLGHYPNKHFTEEIPRKWIHDFQEDLKRLSDDIEARNKSLDIPYTYLDPAVVENSVAI
eukprot:superscaffoldBa00009111_g23861